MPQTTRKRVVLDHVLADRGAGIRNPVQAQTRGQLTGSTQRLLSQVKHVAAALKPLVKRPQCRICQQTGHNARTCRRQAPTPTPAPADEDKPTPTPSEEVKPIPASEEATPIPAAAEATPSPSEEATPTPTPVGKEASR